MADRVQAGAERTAAARDHAETTSTLASPPAVDPAVAAAQVDVLARLHADAAAFYTAQLHSGTAEACRARAMLEGRGVSAAAVAGYELGYAPPGWTALTDHLRGRGYPDEQLLAAGVGLATRRGGVVDRFRDRVMFPVRDPSGERVIAFLGRALTDGEGTPKYLNSPDTALYRKRGRAVRARRRPHPAMPSPPAPAPSSSKARWTRSPSPPPAAGSTPGSHRPAPR